MLNSVQNRKPARRGEDDLGLIIRVTKDIEQKLAEAVGVAAADNLFDLIEQVRDSMSPVAVNHAHALRLIRNDIAHNDVSTIAESPNAKRLRTHKAVRQAHAYVVAEIDIIRRGARPKPARRARQAPAARSSRWLQLAVFALIVTGGVYASQFLGG